MAVQTLYDRHFTLYQITCMIYSLFSVGKHNNALYFPSTSPGYAQIFDRDNMQPTLTFIIWFMLKTLPGTLLTFKRLYQEDNFDLRLKVKDTGKIELDIDNSNET